MHVYLLSSCSMETVSDHDYLNFDPKNPSMWLDTTMEDKPISHETANKASQVADSHGQVNSDPVRGSSSEPEYENLTDYLHEPDHENIKALVQDLPPRVLPARVSEKTEENGCQSDDQEMEDKMEDTEGTTKKSTEIAESKRHKLNNMVDAMKLKKEEVSADVNISQSCYSSTSHDSAQVELTVTHGSLPAQRVSPKPLSKLKKQTIPPLSLASSETTNYTHSNCSEVKEKPPTPVRKSSLNKALKSPSPTLNQWKPSAKKIPPTIEGSPKPQGRHTSIRHRAEQLERAIKSGCSSSATAELTASKRNDVMETSSDSSKQATVTAVDGASKASGASSPGGSDLSSSCSPSRTKEKTFLKVEYPPSTDVTFGAPTKHPLTAEGEENSQSNTEQLVENELQEQNEMRSPTTMTTVASPLVASPNGLDSVTTSPNRHHRPRLTQIRNKIAQRKEYEDVCEVKKTTISPRLQSMNKEQRPNLADIRKKVMEKLNPKETSGAESNKLPMQSVVLCEPSQQNQSVTENAVTDGNEETPVSVISRPGPPPTSRQRIPPPPPKYRDTTRRDTASARSEKEEPANVDMGRLGTKRVEEEVVTSPPPTVPNRTKAIFEIQPAPPGASIREATYFHVTLRKGSDPSVSAAAAIGTKTEETADSSQKKKTPFTKVKSEQVDQHNKKKTPEVGERKTQVSPTKKSFFLTSPTKKKGQTAASAKQTITESQTVESRANFVVMAARPLPEIPGQSRKPDAVPDHTEEDYEEFVFDNIDIDYENYPQLPKDIFVKKGKAERCRSEEPMESKSAPSTPAMQMKSSTLGRQENSGRPVPARQTSSEYPDYIDGYVNTNQPPIHRDPVSSRPLPRIPFSSKVTSGKDDWSTEGDNLDYDYPDLRLVGAFPNLPARQAALARVWKSQKLRDSLSTTSSSDGSSVDRVGGGISSVGDVISASGDGASVGDMLEEQFRDRMCSTTSSMYVPMASGTLDDSYVNSETIQSLISGHKLPSRTMHRSASEHNIGAIIDDEKEEQVEETSTVYMNLPMPEPCIRSQHHSIKQQAQTLPRSARTEKSCSLDEGSHKVPPVKPKPLKKRSAAIAAQQLVPSTKHPQQDWNSSTTHQKVGVTSSIVAMHSDTKAPSCLTPAGRAESNKEETNLPPRDIPRMTLV